ncbi:hypothetical protein NMY22_g12872 [Coprinellus aureogranulatus]|nr:hypothetical protein NMY22_g12872 [Coprinellus aureogranulatus]
MLQEIPWENECGPRVVEVAVTEQRHFGPPTSICSERGDEVVQQFPPSCVSMKRRLSIRYNGQPGKWRRSMFQCSVHSVSVLDLGLESAVIESLKDPNLHFVQVGMYDRKKCAKESIEEYLVLEKAYASSSGVAQAHRRGGCEFEESRPRWTWWKRGEKRPHAHESQDHVHPQHMILTAPDVHTQTGGLPSELLDQRHLVGRVLELGTWFNADSPASVSGRRYNLDEPATAMSIRHERTLRSYLELKRILGAHL